MIVMAVLLFVFVAMPGSVLLISRARTRGDMLALAGLAVLVEVCVVIAGIAILVYGNRERIPLFVCSLAACATVSAALLGVAAVALAITGLKETWERVSVVVLSLFVGVGVAMYALVPTVGLFCRF